jgi:hypothetical protein
MQGRRMCCDQIKPLPPCCREGSSFTRLLFDNIFIILTVERQEYNWQLSARRRQKGNVCLQFCWGSSRLRQSGLTVVATVLRTNMSGPQKDWTGNLSPTVAQDRPITTKDSRSDRTAFPASWLDDGRPQASRLPFPLETCVPGARTSSKFSSPAQFFPLSLLPSSSSPPSSIL